MTLLSQRFFHRSGFSAIAFAILLAMVSAAFAQTTTPPLPKPVPFHFVNDYAGVIDAATRDRLERRLTALRDQTKIEIAVVTIKTTGGQDVFDYSLALARGWGVGSKEDDNPAMLMLIAVDDRKWFTQISRDMEGDIPDGLRGQIEREKLVPAFKQGRYGDGISDTIEAYIARLEEQRNFKLSGETAPTPRPARGRQGSRLSPRTLCCGAIVIIIILLVLSRFGNRGGRGGGGGGGLWNALLIGSLLGNLAQGGRSGGWSSGGFGDSGGGSWGGGGGGFGGGGFGGGGDFGGGGGGGSW
jgi:uncharacterized protein